MAYDSPQTHISEQLWNRKKQRMNGSIWGLRVTTSSMEHLQKNLVVINTSITCSQLENPNYPKLFMALTF